MENNKRKGGNFIEKDIILQLRFISKRICWMESGNRTNK